MVGKKVLFLVVLSLALSPMAKGSLVTIEPVPGRAGPFDEIPVSPAEDFGAAMTRLTKNVLLLLSITGEAETSELLITALNAFSGKQVPFANQARATYEQKREEFPAFISDFVQQLDPRVQRKDLLAIKSTLVPSGGATKDLSEFAESIITKNLPEALAESAAAGCPIDDERASALAISLRDVMVNYKKDVASTGEQLDALVQSLDNLISQRTDTEWDQHLQMLAEQAKNSELIWYMHITGSLDVVAALGTIETLESLLVAPPSETPVPSAPTEAPTPLDEPSSSAVPMANS